MTKFEAHDIEQMVDECDGQLPSVCRALLAERLRGAVDVALKIRKRRPRTPAVQVLPEDRARVVAAYAGCCAYCRSTKHVGLDFLVPPSRQGTGRPENVVPACARCRKSRRAKHLDVWFASRLDFDTVAIYARIARATIALRRRPAPELRRAA